VRRRLYLQIHAALVATLVVAALLGSLARLWLEPLDPVGFSWEHVLSHWLLPVGALILLLTVAAYPVARRITSRLERLQSRVEALGGGDLTARVEVEGNDEVADLARSFNRAAERIAELVDAQKRLLAGASHELRSPLARLRVAAELLGLEGRPELREQVARDIAELDELVDELLLASRLEAQGRPPHREEVQLLGLLAEEAARETNGVAEIAGEPVVVQGDPRMLRRLIRNLLDNARRYGGGSAIEASVVSLEPGGVRLRIADRGPGVVESERERIFEPFYQAAGGAKAERGGAGLGLALVRQIARHHGGDARCVAREGGGTCFEVDLAGASGGA
jgi:signal transduction histidine kinase